MKTLFYWNTLFYFRRTTEEITPSGSYSSTLTAKIMNNLAIRCENIILKLVEEDIVFSMNIEKLSFENVNEQWVQAITGRLTN